MRFDVWNGSDGDFSDASNWSQDIAPGLCDLAIIQTGTAVIANTGTTEASIFLGGSSTPAGLTINNTDTGRDSIIVSDATGGMNQILSEDVQANGNTSGRVNYLYGNIFAIAGTTEINVPNESAALNEGVIAAVGIATPATVDLSIGTAFFNDKELLAAGQAVFNIFSSDSPPTFTGLINNGLIEAVAGGTVTLNGPTTYVPYRAGSTNSGLIEADDGTVILNNNVDGGTFEIANKGSLAVFGVTQGGTIDIQSGMLEIGTPSALSNFQVSVAFTGWVGSIEFDTATSLSEVFSSSGNDLAVTAGYAGADTVTQTITLAAGRTYSASDFSVQGNQILFNAHPSATS